MPAIILSHLSWSAPDGTSVLFDLDFRFTTEKTGLVGRNGVGKSTLLALIAGGLLPGSGSVHVDGRIATLRQMVQVAPQESIADNFARLHPEATHNQVRAALARFRFRADLALQQVGTLSGGQILRAALACVLGGETLPPLLMLDEPTNHLDLDSIAAIEQGLAAYDGALILVSHDEAFLDAVGTHRRVQLG